MIVLFVSLYLAFAYADVDSQARLLASKNVENKFIVENKDLVIKYSIFNIGSSPANQVVLNDKSFSISDFEFVRGHLPVEWKSIAPGSNVTHIVVLKPLKIGFFNFTAGQLKYQPGEGDDIQDAFTSFPGEGFIMSEIDFSRKHSPHLLEWSIFALMCMPSLLIPFMLWYRSHSKYTQEKSKKH
ncbi:translocon-associated protein subunit beta [Hydra vulgaris]|uniref:Translocon-associated protein subunit beta n=1 Tax=Hydra vulgaris TaxID=6087 RepID=A0ABM4DES1_HYDVU